MPCQDFPACGRCSAPACEHTGENRTAAGCAGYIGLPDCNTCGAPSWQHALEAPHEGTNPAAPECAAYSTPGGLEQFQGNGGGFGGGGASGGW